MRCLICDVKLKRIIPDQKARGGIRPCPTCEGVSYNALIDEARLYDDSDVSLDIPQTVESAGGDVSNQISVES